MTDDTIAGLPPSRALRLRTATRAAHERLDSAVMAADSFANLAGYRRFVQVQYRFQRDIAALYDDPRLQAALPDLAARQRLPAIAADLADLDAGPVDTAAPVFAAGTAIDLPTALGWLYVAEGSNLGAALLRREAAKLGLSDRHGARHLAPPPAGPAPHWRTFTAALDAITLQSDEEERVIAGAIAAFDRVYALVTAPGR